MFRWSDSRRPQLQYEGHVKNTPLLIERRCDACGVRSNETEPIVPLIRRSVPEANPEIPAFVCIDFRNCCLRYRRGMSPVVFAAQLNWKAYV